MRLGPTTARIIDCAAEVIDEHGLVNASLDQIRRRAEVSTGSLYHHFPAGLTDVAQAVYLGVLAQYHSAALIEWRKARSNRSRVRNIVIHLLDWIESEPLNALRMYQLENLPQPSPVDSGYRASSVRR